MISIVNGKLGGSEDLFIFNGEDTDFNIILLDDQGNPLTITADVIKLKLYATEDRRDAAVLASATATIATAAAGYATVSLSKTEFDLDVPMDGKPYYMFVERNENTGSTFEYSAKSHRVFVK